MTTAEAISLVASGVPPIYLRWNGYLDPKEYVLLKDDWPYKIPKDVTHYCIWSRVSLAFTFVPIGVRYT